MTYMTRSIAAFIAIAACATFLALPSAQAANCKTSQVFKTVIGDSTGPQYGIANVQVRACFNGDRTAGITKVMQKTTGRASKGYGLRSIGTSTGTRQYTKFMTFNFALTHNGKTVQTYRLTIVASAPGKFTRIN